jgi:osmotically-inducible protein OsmY
MILVSAVPSSINPADVREALRQTGYGDLHRVDVSVQGTRVCLNGRVSSFFLKQIAQTSVQTVPGVTELQNNLCVGALGR